MSSFIKTNNDITVVLDDGNSFTVNIEEACYEHVVEAVKDSDFERAYELATPSKMIASKVVAEGVFGDVVVTDYEVLYKGEPVHNTLTERLLEMVREGFNVKPMINFLENLMDNPSYRAVSELYTFLEHSRLPITPDGHFLAYKKVDENLKDIFTGTMDNSVGAIVEMPRNQVDEEKTRTCSKGLHFCSYEYLPHYGLRNGNRVVMVKINPRDVVSIPIDYNNSKGRTCKYEVVQELTNGGPRVERIEGSYRPDPVYEIDFLDSLEDTLDEFTDCYGVEDDDLNGDDIFMDTIAQIDPLTRKTIRTFRSVNDALVTTGVDSSNIHKVLDGKRRTAGGFMWRYI